MDLEPAPAQRGDGVPEHPRLYPHADGCTAREHEFLGCASIGSTARPACPSRLTRRRASSGSVRCSTEGRPGAERRCSGGACRSRAGGGAQALLCSAIDYDGRTAVQPRRQACPVWVPHRNQATAAQPQRHGVDLRHPRPGRSDGALGSDRCDAQWSIAAAWAADECIAIHAISFVAIVHPARRQWNIATARKVTISTGRAYLPRRRSDDARAGRCRRGRER